MTKTAQEYPVGAMAFRPSWQHEGLASGHDGHSEGEDALEFLADLADRIAAACVESQCLHSQCADSTATSRAVPLPRQTGARSDYYQVMQMSADTPSFDSSGVELLTADGHMRPLEDIQADVIRLAISHYNGRISEVARRLRMGRSTLYRKLEGYGIEYKL